MIGSVSHSLERPVLGNDPVPVLFSESLICLPLYLHSYPLSALHLPKYALTFTRECHLDFSDIMFHNKTFDLFSNNWYFLHHSFWKILLFLILHILHIRNVSFFLVIFYLHLNNSDFFLNLKPYYNTFCVRSSMSLSCFTLLMMNADLITEISGKMKHFLCFLRLTSELLIKYNKVLLYFCNTEWQDCLFSIVICFLLFILKDCLFYCSYPHLFASFHTSSCILCLM